MDIQSKIIWILGHSRLESLKGEFVFVNFFESVCEVLTYEGQSFVLGESAAIEGNRLVGFVFQELEVPEPNESTNINFFDLENLLV